MLSPAARRLPATRNMLDDRYRIPASTK
jgi:hypothetical protein